MTNYSGISLWMESPGDTLSPRPALLGDCDVDVAIVGGGYTGLWTAYYLKTLAPHLSIAILEAHVCGFGASGRNGGWLMGALEGGSALIAAATGERQLQARKFITGIVSEVGAVLEKHSIDCDFHHGGGVYAAARYPEQLKIQQQELSALLGCGYEDADYQWLNGPQLSQRLNIRDPLGGIFTPHVARIQPAKLARALAATLEQMGVAIYEQTRVQTVGRGELRTNGGRVRAATRVLAMEGFSYELLEQRRRVLPIQSMIVASEPLTESQWQDIGLDQREVFCDASPTVNYGQRTADDRLVFGARGSYLYGGRPRSTFADDDPQFRAISQLLFDFFPQLQGTAITHRWGGTLGVPRAFHPHAIYDGSSGLATAGGYLGEGVGGANLMARTLADLILDRPTTLAEMPWAHRRHPDEALRRWEPEPLRWLGYQAIDLALRFEESMYRQRRPNWQRRLSTNLSSLAQRIRS